MQPNTLKYKNNFNVIEIMDSLINPHRTQRQLQDLLFVLSNEDNNIHREIYTTFLSVYLESIPKLNDDDPIKIAFTDSLTKKNTKRNALFKSTQFMRDITLNCDNDKLADFIIAQAKINHDVYNTLNTIADMGLMSVVFQTKFTELKLERNVANALLH